MKKMRGMLRTLRTLEVTEDIKRVYNDHLMTTRLFRGNPARPRKDFSGFDEDVRLRYYRNMARWFQRHPEINRKLYFEATLFFHKDDEIIHIKEYCKSSALKNYTEYCKIISGLDLDNIKSIHRCADSFKFIRDFCIDNNIPDLRSYMSHAPSSGNVPSFLNHIKNNSIDIYPLFAIIGAMEVMVAAQKDHETWARCVDPELNHYFFLKRFETSTRYKSVCYDAVEIVNNAIKNNIDNS